MGVRDRVEYVRGLGQVDQELTEDETAELEPEPFELAMLKHQAYLAGQQVAIRFAMAAYEASREGEDERKGKTIDDG